MAYMSVEKKKLLEPAIKKALAKHGLKGRLSKDRFTLILNITEGKIDFIKNFNEFRVERATGDHEVETPYMHVNEYHFQNQFRGDALAALTEIHAAMMEGNHDRSDSMSDYFDVGWYTSIKIGKFDKPYVLTA